VTVAAYLVALMVLLQVLGVGRTKAENYYRSASAKLGKADHEGAIADYTKAIELKPDYHAAYNNRGVARYRMGDYEEAIADWTKAIELKPDFTLGHNNRGAGYERMGKFEQAIEDYRKSLAIDPDNSTARNNLSNLFAVLNGNPEFVKRIQMMLSGGGYYRGDIDGAIGRETGLALVAFQMDSKLEMSGEINNETHELLAKSYRDVVTQTSTAPLEEGEFRVNSPREDAHETTQSSIHLDAVFKGNTEIELIVVKVNDQKVKGMQEPDYNPGRTSANIDCMVPLSRGNNLITLIAFTEHGDVVKKKITVIHNPKEEKRAGKKWAVIIGVEDYEDVNIQDLDFAVDDAEEFTQMLIDEGEFLPNQIVVLTDKREKNLGGVRRATPTYENISRALFTDLRKKTRTEDSVIIYYSGHGALVPDPTSPSGLTAYLVPVDFEHEAPEVRGIKMEEIKRLAYLAPERMFLIIDSCYSGGGKSVSLMPGKIRTMQGEITRGFADVGRGRVLFASSEDHQVSLESEEMEHGIFTYFLIEVLDKGERRLSEVNKHVYPKVVEYTRGAQEPNLDIGEQKGDILLY